MNDIKKIRVRAPSGRIVVRTKRERYGTIVCANCKKPLRGVANIRKLSKTEKIPSRIYGGYLCSGCTKEILREKARKI